MEKVSHYSDFALGCTLPNNKTWGEQKGVINSIVIILFSILDNYKADSGGGSTSIWIFLNTGISWNDFGNKNSKSAFYSCLNLRFNIPENFKIY